MSDTSKPPPIAVPPPPGPPSFVARRVPTLPDKPLQRRVYDVAIIGPDLGGAAAAALLAKRGLRVLMAPLSQAGVARDSDGWLLPAAHPMIPPLRQLSGSIFALDELGLAADLQRQSAGTATGAFQLLGEELRLSLPADQLRRRSELRRELGDEAASTEAALESLEQLGRAWDPLVSEPPPLPARGFFERRKLRKILPDPLPEVPQGIVGEALHALAPFAASLVGDTAPEATAREAAALFRAPLRLWGGAAQLADLLRAKAETAGAHLTTESCSRLRLSRKSAIFELAGAEVQVNMVVLACAPDTIRQLCDGGGRPERAVADEADLKVERKEALAHFVVRPEGLPQALEEAALLLGNPLGPLLISAVPARRARGEVAGERLLTVGRLVEAGFSDGQALLSSVRQALDPVLPFFERHVVHESAELDPVHGQRILKPHEGLHSEPIGLRPVSAAHERVLFASREVYPGFGLEGAILAARACAAQALELSGRKQVSAT
ncbi:MAG TPA: hypothetical protein VEQ15_10965 [Myxococcales bacterium]|nr:hypothetical protein [Myxococcales bacterium]